MAAYFFDAAVVETVVLAGAFLALSVQLGQLLVGAFEFGNDLLAVDAAHSEILLVLFETGQFVLGLPQFVSAGL